MAKEVIDRGSLVTTSNYMDLTEPMDESLGLDKLTLYGSDKNVDETVSVYTGGQESSVQRTSLF